MATRPTALTVAIAAEIRALMAKRGATQHDLATATGKSQSYVSRRLTQVPEKPFDVEDLAAAATLLGTTMRDIVLAAEQELRSAGVTDLSERRARMVDTDRERHAAYSAEDGTSPEATEDDFTV